MKHWLDYQICNSCLAFLLKPNMSGTPNGLKNDSWNDYLANLQTKKNNKIKNKKTHYGQTAKAYL